MSTVKASKRVSINSVSELIAAIHTYGSENVRTHDSYELISYAYSNGVNTSEWVELINIANDSIVTNAISTLFSVENYLDAFVNAFGVSKEQFVHHMNNIALERKLSLARLHESTSLEQLNALADAGLAPLYYVEVVSSIDTDFVRKYYEQMDLCALARHTPSQAVRELANQLND